MSVSVSGSCSEDPSYFKHKLGEQMWKVSPKGDEKLDIQKNGKLPILNKRKISVSEPNLDIDRPKRVRGNSIVNALQFGGKFTNSRKYRSRLVQKNGYCNISLVNVPKQGLKYCSDIFTTLIEFKWRWILFIYCSIFIWSWFFFSAVYYLFVYLHNDFDPINIEALNSTFTPCIGNVKSYTSVFIFTLASQTTIGYGFRYPTEECIHLLIVICLQNLFGVMLQTLMAGVVFAKLARPKKRAETILFSKNACICMRDGQLCFLFRVGDMRKTQLAEAHVRLQMIKKRITDEGELIPFHQYDMDVGFDSGLDRIFLVWPITVCHVIDEDSPLYDISQAMMKPGGNARFEILVLLEGVVESTGATTQARTGYVTEEVLWGHRFEKMATYRNHYGTYRIDFARFHKTYQTEIPPFSAKELDIMEKNQGTRPLVHYQRSVLDEVKDDSDQETITFKQPGLASRVRHKLSAVLERPKLEDLYVDKDNRFQLIENGIHEINELDTITCGADETNILDACESYASGSLNVPEVRKRISWTNKRRTKRPSDISENEEELIDSGSDQESEKITPLPPPQKKMSKFRGHDIM